jgi:hypothetical protein
LIVHTVTKLINISFTCSKTSTAENCHGTYHNDGCGELRRIMQIRYMQPE